MRRRGASEGAVEGERGKLLEECHAGQTTTNDRRCSTGMKYDYICLFEDSRSMVGQGFGKGLGWGGGG
jgi:hypothetical protein